MPKTARGAAVQAPEPGRQCDLLSSPTLQAPGTGDGQSDRGDQEDHPPQPLKSLAHGISSSATGLLRAWAVDYETGDWWGMCNYHAGPGMQHLD